MCRTHLCKPPELRTGAHGDGSYSALVFMSLNGVVSGMMFSNITGKVGKRLRFSAILKMDVDDENNLVIIFNEKY